MFSNLAQKLRISRSSSVEKADGDSDESLLPNSWEEANRDYQRRRNRAPGWQILLLTAFNFILFLFSVSVLLQDYMHKTERNYFLKKTSHYSPVLNKVDIPMVAKQVDGHLFDPPMTPFRMYDKPDHKVDEAWDITFDVIRTFPLTKEEVIKLGKDPEITVRYPEEYGLGEDNYVGQLDVFHLTHCLNLLRTLAWAEYGRDEKHGKKPFSDLHFVHVAHCTDLLLQNLQCQASTDILTFNWRQGEIYAWPDFYINQKCRDWDTLVKWQEENALPLAKGRNFSAPVGAKQITLPAADAFFARLKNQSGGSEEHDHHKT